MDIDGHALRSRRPPGLGARRARGGRSVTIPVMGHVDSFLVQPNIPLSFHSDLILLCPMSSPGGATTRLSRRMWRVVDANDRATVGAKPGDCRLTSSYSR